MIKCAAIRVGDKVLTGRRHHDIFHANTVRQNGVIVSRIFGEQGFVTLSGDFLTREEAAKHALKTGQISKLKFSKTELFSEDIY